jgi:hypothetical protein
MKAVAFHNLPRAAWDALADISDDAWLNHRADWVDVETRYFVSANLSFGIVDGDEIVALQPLYLSNAANGTPNGEVLVHSGIHRHTGLALAPGLARSARAEAQKLAMARILDLALSHGADRVQLNAHNLAPRQRSLERDQIPYWVMEHGFHLGLGYGYAGVSPAPGFAVCNADQIVDLTQSAETLLDAVDPACRRAIRKAEKMPLAFSFTTEDVNIERYWTLAQRSALRTGEQLPPRDYYVDLVTRFTPAGKVALAIASHGGQDVGALLLFLDKGSASFLAGVSEPDALAMRPNDFMHWNAILAAKAMGLSAYRFGPVFPETPQDWPFARVSAFKGKFGGKATPVIQGSLLLNRDYAVQCIGRAAEHMAHLGCPSTAMPLPAPSIAAGNVAHHLRLFGITDAGTEREGAGVLVADAGAQGGWIAARQAVDAGIPVVLLRPERAAEFIRGTSFEALEAEPPLSCAAVLAVEAAWSHLRTLHKVHEIEAASGIVVVRGPDGAPLWQWLPMGKSGMVLVGTDLHRDLVRFRQGDPAAAANRVTDPMWGFAGERPNYLFDGQLDAARPQERMADWWLWTLRDALIRHAGVTARPVLPGNAPGAVIVTGDDDQAALSDYAQQTLMLGDLPVTYFLHPLTRHDRASLDALQTGRRVEFGLHPDALEAPGRYGELFDEQAAWFTGLVGEAPRTVRNHGFLNDGYWGHAGAWKKHGVLASSNLPGLDGRVINGSLLPARLVLNGEMTGHWSLLTAIGDGVVFVHGWDDAQSADCVHRLAGSIRSSGVPGVIVLNLHPENVAKTKGLHDAALELVRTGFVAWTMSECIAWFAGGNAMPVEAQMIQSLPSSDFVRSPQEDAGQLAPASKPQGWRRLKAKVGRLVRPAGG